MTLPHSVRSHSKIRPKSSRFGNACRRTDQRQIVAQIICGWFKELPLGRDRAAKVSGMKLLRLCLTLGAMLAGRVPLWPKWTTAPENRRRSSSLPTARPATSPPRGLPRAGIRLRSRVSCASTIQPGGHPPDCWQIIWRASRPGASPRRAVRNRLTPPQPLPQLARRDRLPPSKPNARSPGTHANPSRRLRKLSASPSSRRRRRPSASWPSRRPSIHCRPSCVAMPRAGKRRSQSPLRRRKTPPAGSVRHRPRRHPSRPRRGRRRPNRHRALPRRPPNQAPATPAQPEEPTQSARPPG